MTGKEFCETPCPAVGCPNTLDPRWSMRTHAGRAVACCDGHGGLVDVDVDPERPLHESPWAAAQARRR